MTFVRRKIDLTFSLGEGTFGDSGFTSKKVTGLRVSAKIERMGLPGANKAEISVHGLSLSDMNQLCSLGKPTIYLRNNRILVEAGDDQSGMATAYHGTIWDAFIEASNPPKVWLQVHAIVGSLAALTPVKPTSYRGAADVAAIMAGLANLMGMSFENNGVVGVTLSRPYFDGTAKDQVFACAQAAGILAYFDDANNALVIAPKIGVRGGVVPLISSTTGLVGYPSHSDHDISLRSVYNPSIKFMGQVMVESSFTGACGIWNVNKLNDFLESETPGGAWFTDLGGFRLGNPQTMAA